MAEQGSLCSIQMEIMSRHGAAPLALASLSSQASETYRLGFQTQKLMVLSLRTQRLTAARFERQRLTVLAAQLRRLLAVPAFEW